MVGDAMLDDAYAKCSWPYSTDGRSQPEIQRSETHFVAEHLYVENLGNHSIVLGNNSCGGLDAKHMVDARQISGPNITYELGYNRDMNAERLLNTDLLTCDGKMIDTPFNPPPHMESQGEFDFASEYDTCINNNPGSFEGELYSLPSYEDFVWFFGS